MKKRIMAGIMATMMVLTMMQTTVFAESEETNKPSTETICEVSDDTPELSSSEEDVESGGKPGEADASFDTEDEQRDTTEGSSETDSETGKSDASLDIEDEEQVIGNAFVHEGEDAVVQRLTGELNVKDFDFLHGLSGGDVQSFRRELVGPGDAFDLVDEAAFELWLDIEISVKQFFRQTATESG